MDTQPNTTISEAPALGARPSVSALRVAISVACVVLALSLIGYLADWSQLKLAVVQLGGQPWLLAVLVFAYTGAFFLRALAWRALSPGSIGLYQLFVSIQAGLLVNHLTPLKLGEIVRPLLAARHGMAIAEAATTTAVARYMDFAALLAIAAVVGIISSLTTGTELWLEALALPAGVILICGGALLSMRHSLGFGVFPRPVRTRLELLQNQLRQLSAKRIAHAMLWTLPSWVLEAAVILVAAEALGVELSITAAVAVTAFTILFQIFHVTPGGIGVYEAVMTGALYAHGVPWEQGLALAVTTHGLKFAYSYTVALAFTLTAFSKLPELNPLGRIRGDAHGSKAASRFEVVAARLWNVLNEGKPFTPVFVLGILGLLSIPHLTDASYWPRAGIAIAALLPMFLLFYRFDFPLKLRLVLWLALAVFLGAFRFVDLTALGLVLGLYLTFTVFLWGTVYYHLRIGTPWTNFTRFWRLVLENPDPTSGNFLEQIPKTLLLILAFLLMVERPGLDTVVAVEGFVLSLGAVALLVHQWFFTWPPAPSLTPTRLVADQGQHRCKRFIAIVIDGCRADRLLEADTPFMDRMRREGVDYVNTSTVYPARTVTGFSSMFTGAPPRTHGMRSNFVPSLGVKCESIFDSLRDSGLSGRLVGIAHLVDAFGDDVETVTAVTHNDEIDDALVARAKVVMERDNPDLLALQLLSVDQTGHARGSYNAEYLAKIEATDRKIEEFLGWCEERGYLDDTTILVTSDHGQGIGIGGHGHMSPEETYVPCFMWGAGVDLAGEFDDPRSVMDVAPTIAYFLGAGPPAQSMGQVLGVADDTRESKPLAVIIPAHNEAGNIPSTLSRIPRGAIPNTCVIVVDDGSSDGSAEIARQHGADLVASHPQNRGLGAALRTGLAAARSMDARAAVYVDADGEYPPEQIPDLLKPIEEGEADYVLGSRYLGTRERQPFQRFVANVAFTGLLCVASGRRITDGQTGFRAFSRKALECAEIIHDYNYAQVLTLDLLKKGMRLKEVPISYRFRTKGKSFISVKYLWRVPAAMLREMLS